MLGPLASRDQLARGELKTLIQELASQTYHIPGSKRTHLSPQAIQRWYYAWLKGGIDALVPKIRSDKHASQLSTAVQSALLASKQDNPARSINTVISLLERQGIAPKRQLSRATVHRFLHQHHLSKRTLADASTIERRSFVAAFANDMWHGDVLHGPSIQTPQGRRKTYLVSLLDDASRLLTHSAFCLGETALDIEGVLKQAVLKRGIPKKLLLDNGPAYRTHSLQTICARLAIRLIHCRPYEPEGKGKIERFHRTFREGFLNEIVINQITHLADLNSRLWAWIEQVYHRNSHSGLEGKTPLQRWQHDLVHIRTLGPCAINIDDLFYHRHERKVRKDGTVSWEGQLYEVPYELVGQKLFLVVDPHLLKAIRVESPEGLPLGPVSLIDRIANSCRTRQRPQLAQNPKKPLHNAVEMAYLEYQQTYELSHLHSEKK